MRLTDLMIKIFSIFIYILVGFVLIQNCFQLVFCDLQTNIHLKSTLKLWTKIGEKIDIRCGRSHYYGSARRILGGREAFSGEFPWTVSVHRNGQFKCGAAIITADAVLTAAHCVHSAPTADVTIRYNSLLHSVNASQRSALRIIIHPNYDRQTIDNDIAIIILKRSLMLGRINAGSVCLPERNHRISGGDMMTVTGWGLTNNFNHRSSQVLRATDVPMVSMNTCRNQYKHLPDLYKITDNMICAGHTSGGQDACSGDSGGPLVKMFNGSKFVLIGIVSKGYGCALPNKAGVYTKVANYVDWIHQNI